MIINIPPQSNSKSLAVIAFLAKNIGSNRLGRTSLMKLLYFIEEWAGVPLDYSFTIYSYGPFDSEVLSDLGHAQRLGIVSTTVETFNGGYGYKIAPGQNVDSALQFQSVFINNYKEQLDSIVKNFGSESPSDLELQSTIHFAYHEALASGNLSQESLAKTVHSIKPKFDLSYIHKAIDRLHSIGAIGNLDHPPIHNAK